MGKSQAHHRHDIVIYSLMALLTSIATNELGTLDRFPSDLFRYISWTEKIKAEYGSIINFVCKERLRWEPLPSSSAETGLIFPIRDSTPFANAEDYKILRNDWPYGVSPNISHLVVWLKTRIPVQDTDGDLTPESRQMIEDFVRKTFEERLAKAGTSKDRVLWFKNWRQLQSVRGLEHIHVLVRDVPESILNEWTADRG